MSVNLNEKERAEIINLTKANLACAGLHGTQPFSKVVRFTASAAEQLHHKVYMIDGGISDRVLQNLAKQATA